MQHPFFSSKPHALALAISATLLPYTVHASEVRLPRIDVIGESEQDVARQPGAVAIVTTEDLATTQPMSTEDALRNIPGVVIKPEEESAVVANIGIRGLSAADYKSLILEDGVPVAPGLFVGNGRYYNPRIQRMESIEVLKGAASLRYGPNTIGGVINYKTKQPDDGVAVAGRVGSFGYREAVLEAGGSAPSGEATAGVVYTRARSDGFQNKGFEMEDLMLKGGMLIGDNHWISAKVSHYDNEANISYRGLFLDAFRADANFNPAPDDWFLTTRKSLDLNHEWEIDSSMTLNTLLYWSEMNRDYWRFGTVTGTPTQTVNGLTQWNYSDNVNGNNRAFDRVGLDSRLHVQHDSFGMSNEAEFGFRFMEEEMIDQTILGTREKPRTAERGVGKDTVDGATSYALFAQNRFILNDRLSLTPGLRIEKYEQTRLKRQVSAAAGNSVKTSNTEYVPGVGLTFQATPTAQLYGGIYKAFSPALNGDSLSGLQDQQLDAERSINLEIGVRGGNERVRYELTAFRMEFDNQIIPANSNTNFQNTNGGETLHQGVEGAIGYEFGNGFSIDANATYVPDAEFVGNRYASDGVTITIPDGNRVTYTPELVANLRLGYRTGNLKTALTANYIDEQYTDTANTDTIQENTSGFFTGRLDSYTTVDLTANYDVNKQFSLSAAVKNLTDERYIASLRQGIYAGPSRSFELGGRYSF
ncbi:MAG TPA: TonB-dependent siderophore receptor [Gammaproteobacteria bacterium]|nr:TonB-dependent siderophore receptor [Gammaproteobacteria bacterium]